MTLLHAASRTLLASYFLVNGAKALKDPKPLVPAAEPLADRIVPLVKQYAPPQVANAVPEDVETLIRVNGAVQVFGGLALASGKGRRLGASLLAASLIPSTIAKHPFWSASDDEQKAVDRAHFLKNTSLLGGVLLASADTEGKPSLAWRAKKGGESIAKDTKKATKSLSRGKSSLADSALSEGAALVGTVVATSAAAKKIAAKQLKAAKKQAADAREAAAQRAEEAKKEAKKRAKTAKKSGQKLAKVASKKGNKISKNISLGEN